MKQSAPRVFGLLVLAGLVSACGGSRSASAGAASPASKAPPVAAAPSEAPPKADGPTISRSAISAVVAQGPGAFLQRVELEDNPVFENGRFIGFRIVALKGNPSFWEGVDIKPGDVIRRVNGRVVQKPQDAFDIFRSLERARDLRVDYDRDGAPRTLKYVIVDDATTADATPR